MHLKLSHCNYMAWRNLFHVDLLAVDAYEIAIGKEHYPTGNTTAIRVRQQDFRKRVGKVSAILSACAEDDRSPVSHVDDFLHELWEALKAKYDSRLL